MANSKQATASKKRTRHRKTKSRRLCYMLDDHTIADLLSVQSAIRATSASEAVRRSIRTMSDLVRYVEQGCAIHAVPSSTEKSPVVIDIPAQVLNRQQPQEGMQ